MQGRKHIFDNDVTLKEMLSLRVAGYGPSELGDKYQVDHSTIIYHCKRNGVIVPRGKQKVIASGVISHPAIIGEIEIRRTRITISSKGPVILTDAFDGSRINPGKNYAEYVAEKAKRKEAEFWAKITNKKSES